MKINTPLKSASTAVLALLLQLLSQSFSACAAESVKLTLKGVWPGHARGPAQDIAVQGQYAYVAAQEGGLIILDVSDPANPVRVSSHETSGPAQCVAAAGNHAYVADGSAGLQVIDVSDPANPMHVGGYITSGSFSGVSVAGNHAYLAGSRQEGATWTNGVQVIDISDPANPVRVGGYDTSGYAQGVAVAGNYAYVTETPRWTGSNSVGGGLQVIDVSDPANPVRVGGYDTIGSAQGVAVAGNYAYLTETPRWTGSNSVGGGLWVIDVSDRANPVRVGDYDTGGSAQAQGVAVAGSHAYVTGWHQGETNWINGLQVINVTDPTNPMRVGGYDSSANTVGVAVIGNHTYLAGGEAGLQVIDVSNPANPLRVGGYNTGGWAEGVAVAGGHACVSDGGAGLQVLDVSNPANPARVGGYDASAWARGVVVAGNHAYVTDGKPYLYGEGLVVLDVSDPANPLRVGGYDTSGSPVALAVIGNLAYVADAGDWFTTGEGLLVFDISNPANPVRMGSYNTLPTGMAVVGNHAYLTDYDGLQVIDVSSPASPVRMGGYATIGYAQAVAVAGNHAYVAEMPRWTGSNYVGGGLQVINVTDPTNPMRVGGYDSNANTVGVAVIGNHTYLAGGEAGLQVIDVSDPANPVHVGGHNTGGSASGVAVLGDLIYVADGRSGLLILEQSLVPPPARGWFQVAMPPATAPPARAFHSMVYDSARGVTLMHGGVGSSYPVMTDTWAWDGKNWTLFEPQGPGGFGASMAFDPDRGVAVLHGGFGNNGTSLGATWEWDGETWTQVSPGGGPGNRAGSAMVYDPQHKRVLLQGGGVDVEGNTILSDTWAWDGSSWQQITNANGPARVQHQMAYNQKRQVMVLFGGFGPLGTGPVDTWEFDGTQWHQVATNGPPGARQFPVLTYDPWRQAILLTGGCQYPPYGGAAYKYFNDVWEWNGVAWSELPVPGTHRTPVGGTDGAYDPRRDRVVQFGGSPDIVNHVASRETWEYGFPELRLTGIEREPEGIVVRWTGGAPPYHLQSRTNLSEGDWQDLGVPTDQTSATNPPAANSGFIRVLRVGAP